MLIIEKENGRSFTPFHEPMAGVWYSVISAISRGDLEIVELFLKAGMPLMSLMEDSYNRVETLLEQAITDDQVEMVAMLLNYGANPNARGWIFSGMSCLTCA